jgi:hypothetical protein
LHRHPKFGDDGLHGLAALQHEGGAQAFVPLHEVIHHRLQRVEVQLAAHEDGDGNVVGDRGRIELLDDPHATLRERRRQRGTARDPDDRGQSALRCGRRLRCQRAQVPGNVGDAAPIEQIAQRNFDSQAAADARRHLRDQQRMPAQVEKAACHSEVRLTEDFAPDGPQGLLEIIARRRVFDLGCGVILQARQRAAVDLAIRGQVECLERQDV